MHYSCRTTAGGQENQRQKEHQNYFLTHHKKQQRGKKTTLKSSQDVLILNIKSYTDVILASHSQISKNFASSY